MESTTISGWRLFVQRACQAPRRAFNRILQAIGFPGLIQPIKIDDHFAGTVEVRTSRFYAVLSINGRDLYFNRESGRFDGTGMCIADTA